jgi:hypothetical protein
MRQVLVAAVLVVVAFIASASLLVSEAQAATMAQCDSMLRGQSVTWAPDNDIYRKGTALASTYGKSWAGWVYINPWHYTSIILGRGEILEGDVRFDMWDGTNYTRRFWCVGTSASTAGDGERYNGSYLEP